MIDQAEDAGGPDVLAAPLADPVPAANEIPAGAFVAVDLLGDSVELSVGPGYAEGPGDPEPAPDRADPVGLPLIRSVNPHRPTVVFDALLGFVAVLIFAMLRRWPA